MSCKRLKERASQASSSSSSLPSKKKCLLNVRHEQTDSLTNLVASSLVAGEQDHPQQKMTQVKELSNSSTSGNLSSGDMNCGGGAATVHGMVPTSAAAVAAGYNHPHHHPEMGGPGSEEREQCPTSLSSLKLVQICDTLQNCDMDFKQLDQWGQQTRSDQENREPSAKQQHPLPTSSSSPSATTATVTPKSPNSTSISEKNRQHYHMQRSQRKKELENMWRTVNQAHRKSFPTCHIGKRKITKDDQTEKLMIDSSITIEDIIEKLSVVIETNYDDVKNFAESIPGFQDFPQGDKNILQQIGGLEVCLLHLACGFDKKRECLKVWDERWLSVEKIHKLSKSSNDFTTTVFFELLFSLADSLHAMPLQFHDLAIFSALLLLPSDLQGIQARQQVEVLQEKILNCLSGCLISRNRSCFPCLLAQLLMCMPTLRTLSTTYLELTSHKRLNTPTS